MEVKQINQLMLSMGRYGIKKLSIKRENFELTLERESRTEDQALIHFADDGEETVLRNDFARRRVQGLGAKEDVFAPKEVPAVPEPASRGGDGSTFIDSPMVGTVYLAPSQTDPPFVQLGQRIEENTVVCLVEAMKVMNEVKAGIKGVVAEVLVENAHPVEYSTRLFRIIP